MISGDLLPNRATRSTRGSHTTATMSHTPFKFKPIQGPISSLKKRAAAPTAHHSGACPTSQLGVCDYRGPARTRCDSPGLSLAELRRLRILRDFLAKANPRLRTGCPNVQHRLKLHLIVQRGKADGHNSWGNFALRE
jgi:hypothetical protein